MQGCNIPKIKFVVLLVQQLQHGFTKNAKVSPNLTVAHIVMADSLHSLGLLNIVVLLMYLCVMKDVLFERLFFWSFRPKICTYFKICVAIEGNETRIFIWRE